MPKGIVPRRTRREARRARPVLQVGQTRLEGVVKRLFPEKMYGYIQPKNQAAWIRFHLMDVPYTRLTCVAVGRTVYFTVAGRRDGSLTAIIT